MVGKGPSRDVGEQALYFIDIVGKAVRRSDSTGEQTRNWDGGSGDFVIAELDDDGVAEPRRAG